MNATVIDTLRFADRLKAAGFETPRAEGLARALGEELADRMLTRSDLDEALRPMHADIQEMDARFGTMAGRIDATDAKIEGLDTKIEGLDAKIEGLDTKIRAMDSKFEAKFEALDSKFEAKFEALDSKFEARFDALDSKFEARFDALDSKFEARFDALDSKIEAMDSKFEASLDAKFESTNTNIASVHRELSGKFGILATVMALGFTLLVGLGGYSALSLHTQAGANTRNVQGAATETPAAIPSTPVAEDKERSD